MRQLSGAPGGIRTCRVRIGRWDGVYGVLTDSVRCAKTAQLSTGRRLRQPGRGDEPGLEAHDERATVVIDGRPDRFEQTLSGSRVKGGMVAA